MEFAYVVLYSLDLTAIQHVYLILVIAHLVLMAVALTYHPMYSHAAVSQDTLKQHVIQRLIIVKELIVVMEPVSIHQPLVIHVSVRMGTPETIALLISMTVILIHVLMVYAMMLWPDTLAVASMIGQELIVMLR